MVRIESDFLYNVMNYPFFLRHASDKSIMIPVYIAMLLACFGFIYSLIMYRRNRKSIETYFNFLAMIVALVATLIMCVRHCFIEFWLKNYTFYLILKGITIFLIIPMLYYSRKGYLEEKKRKIAEKAGKGE